MKVVGIPISNRPITTIGDAISWNLYVRSMLMYSYLFYFIFYIDVICFYPCVVYHDDVIKWKHFPRYWPFVRGIHRSPANSPHKGQWRGTLMFYLICAWINGWVNLGEAGDLWRHRAHYDVTVMVTVYYDLIFLSCTSTMMQQRRPIIRYNQNTLQNQTHNKQRNFCNVIILWLAYIRMLSLSFMEKPPINTTGLSYKP